MRIRYSITANPADVLRRRRTPFLPMHFGCLSLAAVAMLISMPGCGVSDRQRVYPVRGTVTFEGKAMPGGGSISFVPLNRQAGKTAGGEIGENGNYELTTYNSGDGSMAGEFRVVIMQAVTMEPKEAPRDGEKIPEGGLVGLTVAEEDQIPLLYADVAKSPLKATVEPRANNQIDFDIKRIVAEPNQQPPGVALRSRYHSKESQLRPATMAPMATAVISIR